MQQSKIPKITHLGAECGVTGSCHLLQANGLNILVDCGSVQGGDAAPDMGTWPVKPSEVDFLFLTHAHVDHIGRIPELVEKGFKGEIITTEPTKLLIVPMLEDAMSFSHLRESQIDRLNGVIDELSWGFEYGEIFDLKQGVRFKLQNAGHILGSCFVRFESANPPWSVLFSGDLGAASRPLLPDPDPPDACDVLILESTYGDTLHQAAGDRVQRLGAVLSQALSDRGKVFIPAFALGRVQEILYDMDRLFSDPKLRQRFPLLAGKNRIPVFLDSPLGLEITRIYSKLSQYWDRESRSLLRRGDHPIDFDQLYAVARHEDHNRLLEMPGPAVIIAGSGMCTGGRIIDHLKGGIDDPRNDIFFVGYQAEGTPGRDIVRYAAKPGGYVCLDGERFDITARVHALSGYSAHADQKGLMDWVKSMPQKPGRIKVVHGDAPAREALARLLVFSGYRVEF